MRILFTLLSFLLISFSTLASNDQVKKGDVLEMVNMMHKQGLITSEQAELARKKLKKISDKELKLLQQKASKMVQKKGPSILDSYNK